MPLPTKIATTTDKAILTIQHYKKHIQYALLPVSSTHLKKMQQLNNHCTQTHKGHFILHQLNINYPPLTSILTSKVGSLKNKTHLLILEKFACIG